MGIQKLQVGKFSGILLLSLFMLTGGACKKHSPTSTGNESAHANEAPTGMPSALEKWAP